MKRMSMEITSIETIEEGYDEFKRYCEIRNYSRYTIRHYDNNIHNFELFHSLENDIETVNQKLIEDYTAYLLKKGLAGKTVATYIFSLRTIVYFFIEKGYIAPFKIKKPKFDKPIKEVYSDSELQLLLRKPKVSTCRFAEYRNWVVINFFISTGLRKNTVTNLKIKDLDLDNGLITLRVVKNRKPTILPLANMITGILRLGLPQ